jgi:hypothetical protein
MFDEQTDGLWNHDLAEVFGEVLESRPLHSGLVVSASTNDDRCVWRGVMKIPSVSLADVSSSYFAPRRSPGGTRLAGSVLAGPWCLEDELGLQLDQTRAANLAGDCSEVVWLTQVNVVVGVEDLRFELKR